MLQKIFKFTGLYVSGRRMDTPIGSFRRFVNSFKDKTGRINPLGKTELIDNNFPYWPQVDEGYAPEAGMQWQFPQFSQVFNGKIFQQILAYKNDDGGVITQYEISTFRYGQELDSEEFHQIENGQDITGRGFFYNFNDIYFSPQGDYSSCVVNNKLYFCRHVDYRKFSDASIAALPSASLKKIFAGIYRFDGMKIARAGLPTPWRHHPITSGGTHRVRNVYMTMGLDAEPIFSNYTECQITPAAGLITTHLGNNSAGMVAIADGVGVAGNYFPTTRHPGDVFVDPTTFTFKGHANAAYFIDTSYTPVYTLGDGVTVKVFANSEQQRPGDWYMFVPQAPGINDIYDAFYVKTIDWLGDAGANLITLDTKIKGFNGYTSTWEDMDLDDGVPAGFADMAAWLTALKTSIGLSNAFMVMSVSADTGGTLDYQVAQILPVIWGLDKTHSSTVAAMSFSRPRLGQITTYMRDWYEHTVVKASFPETIIGITSFSNLLMGYDENALYFSDVSFGGSTEMISGETTFVPPGSEFGKMVACCGAENFLLVGRERRNYIVTGDITTGNVNLHECDVAIEGPANARAVSNAFADQIVFMNNSGIYSVGQTGIVREISADIRDLFLKDKADHGCLFDRAVFKTGKPDYDGSIFKIVLDGKRGFIFFFTGQISKDTEAITQSNILVFDTNDGAWYEWSTPTNCSSIEYVDGKIHFLCAGSIIVESEENPEQILGLNWLTLGEPSLEKNALQVKLYGDFATAMPINIKSQNDWKEALVTDVEHIPSISSYIHKQRLNSSKPLALSVTLESQENGIYLEGMEIELDPLQESMKK